MTAPAVFWPTLLGLSLLAVGVITYRRDVHAASPRSALGVVTLGPALVAASLAAFAGEHFTAATSLAQLVPKWLPAPVFIAYFVGVAHLAAALSIAGRRYIRWSAMLLAILFALFVLLMDLPAAVAHPTTRLPWILVAREGTFAIGALALFGIATKDRWPRHEQTLAAIARIWTAAVLIFYGVEHLLYPQYSPGVPDSMLTAPWVPAPLALAYVTGILLIAFGVATLIEKRASTGAAYCGLLMVLLTLVLYVPQFFVARSVAERVTALNFIFDTLLFAGTVLVISRAIADANSRPVPTT